MVLLGGIFLSIFSCAEGAFADKVILENGDTLTRTVEKVVDGKLTLKTDYAGPIEIQVAKIKKIFTDSPAEVHLTSGEILKGKIETREDGQVIVEKSAEREATSIELPKIASVNPPPPKIWSGSINLGGIIQTGNTDRKGATVAAQVVRRTENDRFRVQYLFNGSSWNRVGKIVSPLRSPDNFRAGDIRCHEDRRRLTASLRPHHYVPTKAQGNFALGNSIMSKWD